MEQGPAEIAPDPKQQLELFYLEVFGWEVISWDEAKGWLIKPSIAGEYVPLNNELAEEPPGDSVSPTYMHTIIVDDIHSVLRRLESAGGNPRVIGRINEDTAQFLEIAKAWIAYGADYNGNWFNLIQHQKEI